MKFSYVIVSEIANFHFLNCIYECINGFSTLKKLIWIVIPAIPLKLLPNFKQN
jgi:hypothetical protein